MGWARTIHGTTRFPVFRVHHLASRFSERHQECRHDRLDMYAISFPFRATSHERIDRVLLGRLVAEFRLCQLRLWEAKASDTNKNK